jgi:hypothetical protein
MDERPKAGKAFIDAWRKAHGDAPLPKVPADDLRKWQDKADEISKTMESISQELIQLGLCNTTPKEIEDWLELGQTIGIDAGKLSLGELIDAVAEWVNQQQLEINRERKRQRARQKIGELASGIPATRPCRLRVENTTDGFHVYLDSVPHSVSDTAGGFIEALIESQGDWVSGAAYGCKSRHLDALPNAIKELIERSTAKGCRLKTVAWLN